MLSTGEIIKAVGQGFTKEELYYLEAQGLILSAKVSVGKIQRRQWDEEDVPRLRKYQEYRAQRFTPKVAWEKAVKELGNQTLE